MRKKLLKIFFLMTSVVVFGQNTKNHWQVANLSGKVKVSHIMEYAVNQDNTQGQKLNDMQTTFNPKGNIIKMKVVNEYLDMVFESFYDKNDLFVESKGFLADGKLASHNKLTYNEKGFKTEERSFSADGFLFQKFTYKHDEKGNEIEKNICSSEEHCSQQVSYKYDAKGNLIAEETFNKLTNKISEKKKYRYDEKNNRIEMAFYNTKDELMQKIVYKYDAFSNVVEENLYDAFDVLEESKIYTYTYDNQHNWLTKKIEIDGAAVLYATQSVEYF